jgi:CDP-glucose 4,6-dehydratase|tara:strand:+ start:68 stop:1183 length:1116 start_codon:yes stop_codon:yes gene_type:complete
MEYKSSVLEVVGLKSNLSSLFKNRKVLITGHTGFKGSWLSIWLDMMGAKVIGYALEPYTKWDNFVVTKLDNRMVHIINDIRDYQSLFDVFNKYKPEIVFHLAAQPLVRESYINPKETYDVNIGGTVNLLECCRLTESVKVIVNTTSDKCYENKEWAWGYRENDRLGGYDPYSSSKAGSELITQAYRNSFFNTENPIAHCKSLSSVRAGNVIGGGDWQTNRLIPDCMRALEKKEPLFLRNPEAIRPWQHVLEPLYGYLLLASRMLEEPGQYCEAWNFGPELCSMKSVAEVAELVIKGWGEGLWEKYSDENDPYETSVLRLDITKSIILLGWKPKWSIEKAVRATVDWYKNYTQNDIYSFCINQIDSYMKSIN